MERRIKLAALTALTAALLVPGLASAQQTAREGSSEGRRAHRTPDPARMLQRAERRLERMKTPLNLNQRQETRIRTALRRGATEAGRVLEQHPDRSPERREALRRVRWETDDRVHAVLNCEQRERFRQLRREHRAERRGDRANRGNRRGNRRGNGNRGARQGQTAGPDGGA